MPGVQVKKEEKRRAIIEAAEKLFAERGIEDVSTSDIAREARVGKGTIYVYFESKEKLLKAVASSVYSSFVKDVRESLKDSRNAEEFLDMMVERVFRNMKTRGKLLYTFHRHLKSSKKDYEGFQKDYRTALKEAYERYKEEIGATFEEFYFFTTSFFMSSYIMAGEFEPGRIKEIVKAGLKKLLS